MTALTPGEQTAQPELAFPPGFLWGAATASYQIEGAVAEDGRGRSIWDTFSHTPGNVRGGDTGDVACDHYHRYAEDVALMAGVGLEAYRFSVAWPRIQPDGTGRPDPRGLDFYRRLVDTLLEAGITPVATLYHWDLPQALQDAGGWPERDTAFRFADYAGHVHAALGDRVDVWTTLNEPFCSSYVGYGSGRHAPGRRDWAEAVRAHHHLLLAHGLGLQAIRAGAPTPATRTSISLNLAPVVPRAPADAGDREAAVLVDTMFNTAFLDPVLRGRYPELALKVFDRYTPVDRLLLPGDSGIIAQPIDFLGVNYYWIHVVAAASAEEEGTDNEWVGTEDVILVDQPPPYAANGWPVQPDGLADLLIGLSRDYPRVPLMVTENGAAFDDVPDADGQIRDADRVAYLDAHLRAAHRAVRAGADLRGYFVWSLLDNFEWSEGYAHRFGLIHVDFPTGRRTPKASARWYGQVAARRGLRAPGPGGGDLGGDLGSGAVAG